MAWLCCKLKATLESLIYLLILVYTSIELIAQSYNSHWLSTTQLQPWGGSKMVEGVK